MKCQILFSGKGDNLYEMSKPVFFPRKQDLTFHTNCLHLYEMSKPVFWEKKRISV